jgi:hypothetical protein
MSQIKATDELVRLATMARQVSREAHEQSKSDAAPWPHELAERVLAAKRGAVQASLSCAEAAEPKQPNVAWRAVRCVDLLLEGDAAAVDHAIDVDAHKLCVRLLANGAHEVSRLHAEGLFPTLFRGSPKLAAEQSSACRKLLRYGCEVLAVLTDSPRGRAVCQRYTKTVDPNMVLNVHRAVFLALQAGSEWADVQACTRPTPDSRAPAHQATAHMTPPTRLSSGFDTALPRAVR